MTVVVRNRIECSGLTIVSLECIAGMGASAKKVPASAVEAHEA